VEHATQPVQLPDVDQSEHFALLTASPESFRRSVLEKLDLLLVAVRAQLAGGLQRITGYDGCVPITRNFDQREQAEIIEKAERDIARQKALVESHFRELHALVSALVT
jgi:hypothetical protein